MGSRLSRLCAPTLALAVLQLVAVAQSPVPWSPVALPCGANTAGGATLPQLAPPGAVVARVEAVLGPSSPFLLRATVPVPRGTLVRGAPSVPFCVKDADGRFAPTQVEVVASHPRDEDGASVVEVLALVSAPKGAYAGERAVYEVARRDSAVTTFHPAPAAAQLWAAPEGVRLRSRDLQGTLYEADLLADTRAGGATWRVLGEGPLRRSERAHEVLMPARAAATPAGSPPHSMGVVVHWTRYAHTGAVALDLVLHDAFSGLDPADPRDDVAGDLLFDSIELLLPSGWRVAARVEDPFLGQLVDDGTTAKLPIVAPLQGGAFHCLPQRGRFQRRFVLAPAVELADAEELAREAGLGFVVPGNALFSWWNPSTANYWPQRVAFPSWDAATTQLLRLQLDDERARLVQALSLGLASPSGYPIASSVLGWAHPYGVAWGGMGGGDEIWLWDGVDAAAARSIDGVLAAQSRMRMYVCRQPNILYGPSGDPLRVEQCTVDGPDGPIMPVWWQDGPLLERSDPWGLTSADQSQRESARASGLLAPYDAALRAYLAIDSQHLVRHTRSLKTLAWLANDPLAKDELEAQAEGWRLSYPMLPQRTGGDAIETGCLAQRRHVDAHPANGVAFTRGHAWGLDALEAWHALAPPVSRARNQPLFKAVATLLADAQADCGGTILAAPSNHDFGGLYSVRAQTETAMIEHALLGLRRSVLDGVDPCAALLVDRTLAASYASTIAAPVWRSAAPAGPLFKVAVGPYDDTQPLYCGWAPLDGQSAEIDAYQSHSSLAHAYEATRAPVYLQRARELLGVADLEAVLQVPLENWHNRLALQRLVEDLRAGR